MIPWGLTNLVRAALVAAHCIPGYQKEGDLKKSEATQFEDNKSMKPHP